ncbi:unnamed protein product, partial [Staurois parvus]
MSAHQCCQSVLSSVSHISAHQCCISVPISAAYQYPSLLHISAASAVPAHQFPPVPPHQCCLSMPPHQCPSVLPISAHQCCLALQPH